MVSSCCLHRPTRKETTNGELPLKPALLGKMASVMLPGHLVSTVLLLRLLSWGMGCREGRASPGPLPGAGLSVIVGRGWTRPCPSAAVLPRPALQRVCESLWLPARHACGRPAGVPGHGVCVLLRKHHPALPHHGGHYR